MPSLTSAITATGGFSPQLMRSVSILRMSAPSLAQFLSQHNNPYLRAIDLPPLPADTAPDIRTRLHALCHDTPAPPGMRDLLEWLIECIGDDGFLELPEPPPLPPEALAPAISHLQALAPAGVAARSAAERVLLLLRQTPPSPLREQAETLVSRHWHWLQRKRWDKLPKRRLTDALALIESLSPPDLSPPAAVSLPDALLSRRRGLWRASAAVGAAIRARREKTAGGSAGDWRLAGDIVAAVTARRRWILTAAQYAADRQSAFLENGPDALRPLPLKQAARELNISVPMLSHIISGKRIICAGGEFPLKYMFNAHTESTVIQYKIQQLLVNEDRRHPYSDEQLRELLTRQGISLSRRIVAKHRRHAGFAASPRRKRAGE